MGYVYAGMWFLVGLILIFRMGKENKVFYLAGGFFWILGAWWLFNTLYPELKLFEGVWGNALKVVTGVVLLVFCFVFYKETRGTGEKKDSGSKPNGGKS